MPTDQLVPTAQWQLKPISDPAAVERLRTSLNELPEALARALVLRGVATFDEAKAYFRPRFDAHVHDPFLMQDMQAAAERVARAVREGERVLVYGDYDVDGTTSTALMVSFLRELGADVSFFIPHRIDDGYGLGPTGIDTAAERGAALIVALDCGITAVEEAAYARSKGIDLVICDHHTPGDRLPDATAVLDPKRADCVYPFKELSGCGVGFKLAQAVAHVLDEPPERVRELLDLVAMSIASDIVPIGGENRVLMREGLKVLEGCQRPGIVALAEQARVDLSACTSQRIVFSLGPRINAAGRMGDAGRAVDLLLEPDPQRARVLAGELEAVNQERRALDRATQQEARRQADRLLAGRVRHGLVLHEPHWHPGVIGIVASRITEHYFRPAVMLTTVDGILKGSARSFGGVNVYRALQDCEDLLLQFGGHDFAAGMTLAPEHLLDFRDRFDGAVRDRIALDELTPAIDLDARLSLDEIGGPESRFWRVLDQFAPFGPENMRPVFQASDLEVIQEPRLVGREQRHLKFFVRQRGGRIGHEVIGWGKHALLPLVRASYDQDLPLELAFSIEANTYRGQTRIQLLLRDARLEREA